MFRISMTLLLLAFYMIGCSRSSSILTEVTEHRVSHEVMAFIDIFRNTNGIYLFSRVGEQQYIIVNQRNVLQVQQASYIESIQSEIQGTTLRIHMEERYTDNYDDTRIGKLRIYRISRAQDFEQIRFWKNNIETPFNLVGG